VRKDWSRATPVLELSTRQLEELISAAGNLLRSPLGDLELFPDSVQAGYTETGGTLPVSWRKMSLLADLCAWMDFLSRPDTGPELISDAQSVVTDLLNHW
jgi:hypothetical protein